MKRSAVSLLLSHALSILVAASTRLQSRFLRNRVSSRVCGSRCASFTLCHWHFSLLLASLLHRQCHFSFRRESSRCVLRACPRYNLLLSDCNTGLLRVLQREILSRLNNIHPSPAITNSKDAWRPNLDGEVSPGAGWQPQGDEGRPKWMFSWFQTQLDDGEDGA